MTVFVGIDPGVNGGLAALQGGQVVLVQKNLDAHTVVGFIQACADLDGGALPSVAIEAVPKWCGEERFAKHAMTGSAMATMFGTFQLAVGVCVGMGIEPTLLTPVKWQNLVECRNRERLETTPWKNKLKRRAEELYPDVKLTLWNCDAVLIAHASTLLPDVGVGI